MNVVNNILVSSWTALNVSIVVVMLLLVLIFILIACKFKPWRRLMAERARRRPLGLEDDIERPLVAGDVNNDAIISNDSSLTYSIDHVVHQTHGVFDSNHLVSVIPTQKPAPQLSHSDSFVLDIPNSSEDSFVSQTLKRPLGTNQFSGERKYQIREDVYINPRHSSGSTIMLEVISGPSRGLQHALQSTNVSKLPATIGRVSPGDIILKDSEVSGKHAMINWNANKLKWELVDMGSLNGTLLNSHAINTHQSGSRHWSNPTELSSGDIITFGTTSKISVHITAEADFQIPFSVGVASDPMSVRRGGKKLPMEDVCYYKWPLHGTHQFGLFGICDGHGGADAATSVSKIMPEVVASILSDPLKREKVLSQCDASDILQEAFYQTERHINHYYEGCTATVLLVWTDGCENYYAQCANVGDSACVMNVEGKQIKMSEDHRVSSYSERLRMQSIAGLPLRDGETRICGINLARMLGDKFLKEQDARFSAEPYISEAVRVDRRGSKCFALLASDGFWDVITTKKAVQLVDQGMERNANDEKDDNSAEKMANFLLSEARTQRTKDNTSIVFLDFSTKNDNNNSCNKLA